MSDHAPIVIGKLVPFRQGTTFEKLPSPQVFILVDGTKQHANIHHFAAGSREINCL